MIGRKQEIKKIEAILSSKRSEFLAVTGRRRVGKTYLIDTLMRKHYCFSLTGIQNGNTSTQLVNFGIKLSEFTKSDTTLQPKNWQVALLHLKTYLRTLSKKRKHVIFFDELPWIHTTRSGFLQILAHLWNDYLSKEKHFILVICGSATSWITKKIINDKGGLHNRLTELIHLHPFTISETSAFLKSKGCRLTNQEIVKIYMALGGVPFYLENIKKGESFTVAIERICFSPLGILRNEYQNLYDALFNKASLHKTIVEVLVQTPSGLTNGEILKKAKISPSGSYTRAMEELINSDFVIESVPFNNKKRGTLYRLIDEYSIFYHRFIRPNKKYTPGVWQQLSSSQSYKIWAGYAFESFCFKHISAIKKSLGISSVYTEISNLRVIKNKNTDGFQIDLVIDRKDDSINLCEIKFHAAQFTINKSHYNQLLTRKSLFQNYTKTKKQVFMTLISNHGLKRNAYADEIIDSEISLEDLMN